VQELWALGPLPGRGQSDPTIGLEQPAFDPAPGHTKWIVTEMGPDLEVPMHDTPTIDYGLVVSGEVLMGLDVGEVRLGAGDAVMVDGVRHSWRAGPQGCMIATVLVGLRAEDR